MTIKELKTELDKYPEDMKVKIFRNFKLNHDLTNSDFAVHSDTAYVKETRNKKLWNHPDGKVMLGDGEKFLLMNYPQL